VLEVNLVVVDGEVAVEHPSVRASLVELARAYGDVVGGRAAHQPEPQVSAQLFEEVGQRARRSRTPGGIGARSILLRRVEGNCQQLAHILGRPPVAAALRDGDRALPLRPHEILTVRKAWEVGVRPVVMQTVVQLDGDVVVRTEEAGDHERRECLVRFHQATLAQGSACWLTLFESAGLLATGALRGMLLTFGPSGAPRRPSAVPKPSGQRALALARDLRSLLVPLVSEGGSSILTSNEVGPAARTVIQPDGDLVCFLSAGAVADEAAHRAHAAAVAAWGARLAASLRAATAALRAATPLVALATAVAWSALAGSLWSLLAVAGTLAASLLGAAALRAAERASSPRLSPSAAGRAPWLARLLLVVWGVALVAVGWVSDRLLLTVGPVVVGVGLSLLAQRLLRRALGLDAARGR
jgi:hypothetical protein